VTGVVGGLLLVAAQAFQAPEGNFKMRCNLNQGGPSLIIQAEAAFTLICATKIRREARRVAPITLALREVQEGRTPATEEFRSRLMSVESGCFAAT
jgi:hypothetical protein